MGSWYICFELVIMERCIKNPPQGGDLKIKRCGLVSDGEGVFGNVNGEFDV